MVAADCGRHFPFVPDPTLGPDGYPFHPYYTVRCDHKGIRFVVEIANQATGFRIIDYVEDGPDGMIVEANSFGADDPPGLRESVWRGLVGRMERGDGPDPSRSDAW